MQEVASSTHSHAAHAHAHAARHAKAQKGSDFTAILEDMAPPNPDSPQDASAPAAGQSPAGEQKAQPTIKTGEIDGPAQSVVPSSTPAPAAVPGPAAEVPDPDQQLKTACLEAKNRLPISPKASEKQNLLDAAQPKAGETTEASDNQPTATDKPVSTTAVVSQAGNVVPNVVPSPAAAPNVAPSPAVASIAAPSPAAAPNVATSPATAPNVVPSGAAAPNAVPSPAAVPNVAATAAAAPAQPVLPVAQATPPEQQTQASAAPGLPQGAAFIAPMAGPAIRQISPDAKPSKQGQAHAPAQPDADDQPQGVAAPNLEQGAPSPAGAKPASTGATLEAADKTAGPARRSSLELAAKSDARQTFDDLLNAPATPTDAAAPTAQGAMPANQAASTSPATAATSAPQNLLGPVPLSGIPVLIAGRALAGSNHFDIRLDPPELGRIEVRLKIDRDGQVSSHLIADRADTLALLRRDQTGLERALQDAGLKTAGDGLQFSLRDQGGNGQPDGRAASPAPIVQDASNPLPDLPSRGYASYVARAGGIDIHV